MKKIIEVTGMHCQHCAKAVEDEIKKIDGVGKVKADPEKNSAIVTMKGEVSDELLIKAVEEAGFTPGVITIKEGFFG